MRTIITLIAVLFASVGMAGERIPQSATIRVPLKAYQSSDHIAAATGKTMAVVISKNGGAFGNPSAGATNATEISNGWYYVDLSTTDTGTLGPLVVRGTATGTDDVEIAYDIVNANNHGLAALPNAAAAANGGVPTVDSNNAVKVQAGTGTGQLDFTSGVLKANVTQYGGSNGTFASGRPEVNVSHFGGSAGSFSSGRPSVNVNTNNDKTGYALTQAFPTNFDTLAIDGFGTVIITGTQAEAIQNASDQANAIRAKTDNLPASFPTNFSALGINASGHISRVTLADTVTTLTGHTPQTGDSFARLGAPTGASLSADLTTIRGYVDTEVAAIKAKTDLLPAAFPDNFDSLLIEANGMIYIAPTQSELFAQIDQTTSFIYAAVDTEVSAIKAKTDNLPASPAAVGSAMTLTMSQSVPTSNTAQTVGDALNASRAQGFGKWVKSGTTLTLYAADGTTVVRTFTLDDADQPSSRQ